MRRTTSLSLIILLFLSLCLITFSVMTLQGALSDRALCERSIARTDEYYAADAKAQVLLEDLDNHLAANAAENRIGAPALPSLGEDLQLHSDLWNDIALKWMSPVLSFEIPVREDQVLHYEVQILSPDKENEPFFEVVTKQIINRAAWTPDHGQTLFTKPS